MKIRNNETLSTVGVKNYCTLLIIVEAMIGAIRGAGNVCSSESFFLF